MKMILLRLILVVMLALLTIPFVVAEENRVFSLTLEGRNFDKSVPDYALHDIFVGVVPLNGKYYAPEFVQEKNLCRAQLFDADNNLLLTQAVDELITQPTDATNLAGPHYVSVQVKYHPEAARLEFTCRGEIVLKENVAIFRDPKPVVEKQSFWKFGWFSRFFGLRR